MHPTLILALASLTSARTLQPRDFHLSTREISLPNTPTGGLPATAQAAVASVLGDNGSGGRVGPGNWTGACTQAATDLCKSPGNLGTLEQWVWSQNTNSPTCMVGLWQPNPNPTDPNVPKGVQPLTQDNCNLYFGQIQTTLQAIIQKNPSLDRGSVNIVNFPNDGRDAPYSAGSQVDSTRPSFIMQPLKSVPQDLEFGGPSKTPPGSGQGSAGQSGTTNTNPSKCGPREPQHTTYTVTCTESYQEQCTRPELGAYCESPVGFPEFCGAPQDVVDGCKAQCHCLGP